MAKRGTRAQLREKRVSEMDESLLDATGAARVLGTSRKTIYQMASKGEIPSIRLGREYRFHRQSLIDQVKKGSLENQVELRLNKVRSAKRYRR